MSVTDPVRVCSSRRRPSASDLRCAADSPASNARSEASSSSGRRPLAACRARSAGPAPAGRRRDARAGATRLRSASRSSRLVMVPEVTWVASISWPGVCSYGGAGAAQRGQHVELVAGQAVPAKACAPLRVEQLGQPADPAQHLQRLDVEVRALGQPRGGDRVHFVGHARQPSEYLLTSRDILLTSSYLAVGRLPMRWDPAQYAKFSDERSRPFFDLVGQIGAVGPGFGGGPGLRLGRADRDAGRALAGRGGARAGLLARDDRAGRGLRRPASFALADAADFDATGVDVLVSNALLQWVPGHQELLVRWAGQLAAGGWLAFQVPANFGSPSHRLMRELAGSDRLARPAGRRAAARRRGGRARRVPGAAAGAGLRVTPGRRPTCTCCRARTRCWSGCAAPGCGRCWPRCPPTRPPSS